MDRILLGAMVVALGVGLVLLVLAIWRNGKDRERTRSGYLSRCRALFRDPRERRADTGFPRLAGQYGSHAYDIQVVPDTLTFRKLPALWVLVTLTEPVPVQATLDLVIRPTGFEPFTRFHRLSEQVRPPLGFPHDCAIRTDDPAGLPPEEILRGYMHLFDDPRIKELVISPKGLRLVFLAEEAERGRYLIYRDAEMGQSPLCESRVAPLLEVLAKLKQDLVLAQDPGMERKSA